MFTQLTKSNDIVCCVKRFIQNRGGNSNFQYFNICKKSSVSHNKLNICVNYKENIECLHTM